MEGLTLWVPVIAVTITFVTAIMVPFGKWIASMWRKPLLEEAQARREAEERVTGLEQTLSKKEIEMAFLNARNEALERELGHWESGRWSKT